MKYRYINREISWLQFNDRVLQEAESSETPLYERIKFLGIFSNNQDEFFRVRVATLHRLVEINKKQFPNKSAFYRQILNQIYELVKRQQEKFTNIYHEIREELKREDIFLLSEKDLDTTQGEYVRHYFVEKVHPYLFPIILKNFNDPESLKDKSIYLAVILKNKNAVKENYALIKIPVGDVSRFLVLPEKNGKKYIILLDDIIRYCLKNIFSIFNYDRFDAYTIKFTRDAELDIDEDVSKSFIEIMSESLKKRTKGSPVRFVYDRDMPVHLLNKLTDTLSINKKDHLVEGGRYHNFKDFINFPRFHKEAHQYTQIKALSNKCIPDTGNIFDCIRKKDVLLHYPYQSFQYVVDWLRQASIDPKVRSIKVTLYRVANPSSVINALINASRNGKSVKVFLEVQARFDEKMNIYWTEKLQAAGVKIIKSIPGFKVHSKLIQIRRKEKKQNVYYSYIGTGNLNETTARLYCDEGLFTCKPNITMEVNKVFELFEATFRPVRFRTLIVSPFSTRNHFIKLLDNEILNAKEGKEAWAIIKLNNLADYRIANKLYQASQAGVKLKLIIRSICILVPGIPGLSNNIEVYSIVDKFLEHSRMLIFCNNNKPLYYLGSADWMIRNLDNRVEVTCPVYDPDLQQEIQDILTIQLQDNVKSRIVDSSFNNHFKSDSSKKLRSQDAIYEYLKKRHEK